MDKPEWFLKLYWNFGFAFLIPSWKYINIFTYLHEYIISLRMRPDMKPVHVVMYDNNEPKGMQA